ncbi:hypothetical protein OG828_17360 [Streptomyces sp. NBC_00457]|uniref:hypothetical protein n=1 Tax=Streptomyces sp. NBC_00457 TaxID=2975748 RepID=UPI002E1A2B30
MSVRKAISASVTATASVAAILAINTPAQAAETTVFCGPPAALAPGCFYSTGDYFTVQDMRVDGLRAVLLWETDYGRKGECHDANGANNPPTKCDYDFKEGHTVLFKTVLRNGANGADQGDSNPMIAWISGR